MGFKKGYVPWNKGLTGKKFLRHFTGGVHNSVGTKHSAETILRMKRAWKSKFRSGYVHPCTGRHPSIKTRKRMSISQIQRFNEGRSIPYFKGKCMPDKIKKKISITMKKKFENGELVARMKGKRHTMAHRKRMSELFSLDGNPAWLGGSSFEPYASDFNKKRKEDVKNYYGRLCMVCSGSERRVKLLVHHIDYDKKNNSFKNLVPVHRYKCHSETNFNRDFWKIYFRDIVRQWKAE